jgi:hypothetical protein
VHDLIDLARRYPEAHAIAPLQAARHHDRPIFTAVGTDGKVIQRVHRDELVNGEIVKVRTAHFGLTLFRAEKLKALPKPWMTRKFDETGGYHGENAMDPDVQFWESWANAGNTIYVALRVPVGHADLTVRWPDINLEAIHQKPADFFKQGPPRRLWK